MKSLFIRIMMCAGTVILLPVLNTAPAHAVSYYPSLPGNVRVTVGNGTLDIMWDTPEPGYDNLYYPYQSARIRNYKTVVYATGTSNVAGLCDSQAITCSIQGLTNGTAYSGTITVCNTNNRLATDNYCTQTGIGPVTPCCGVPSAPPRITATAGNAKATVSWDPPTNSPAGSGPVLNYVVTSSASAASCQTLALSCEIGGLSNGTAYAFYVTAVTAIGTGPASAASAVVVPAGPPGPPMRVQAFLGKGNANVTWIGPESNGGAQVSHYQVVSNPGGLSCDSTGALSCKVGGLSNGQTYTFTVQASNSAGTGPVSGASSPAKLVAGPTAPLKVRASAQGTSATVSWSPPASLGGLRILKYVVTSSPGGATCTTVRLSCTFNGLSTGTRFIFTVQASNAKGQGLPATSNAVSTPKPDQQVG